MKIIPKIYSHSSFLNKIRYGKNENGEIFTELDFFKSINDKIPNNFAAGSMVVLTAKIPTKILDKIIENNIESDFEIGDSFLVRECLDLGQFNFNIKLNGIILKNDQFGFEKGFNSYYFTPQSSARSVLQGMGYKFDRFDNIIK